MQATLKYPSFSAVTELLKPITWFPPMWAFTCGVVASKQSFADHWYLISLGVLLSGPLVCATSQAVNDWFDRHVDAINEPKRPIPSGRMPGQWGLYIAIAWTLLSLLVATALGFVGFCAAVVGLALAWAYSAPPLRLKLNGWWGNAACGICYEGVAWVTGAAVVAQGAVPDLRSITLAVLYSLAAHGIMTLNDFKSIKGDIAMGVRSIPVQLGAVRAAQSACLTMLIPQLIVIALLTNWGKPWHALAIAALVIGQIILMRGLVRAPVEKALFYSGFGVPLLVSGMMVSAFALRYL